MPAISASGGSLSIALPAVSFANAGTAKLDGSSTSFQIVSQALRRLDPSNTPLVEIDTSGTGSAWVTADPSGFRIDYLFGVVSFYSAPSTSTLVRVSGAYLPTATVALVRSLTLSISNDVVELQVFGDGYKRRAVTLRDFSGEMSGVSTPTDDLDPGAGLTSIAAAATSGAAFLAEFASGGSKVFRAWVKVPELSHKLAAGALYEHTVKFVGFAFPVGRDTAVAWGYGSP